MMNSSNLRLTSSNKKKAPVVSLRPHHTDKSERNPRKELIGAEIADHFTRDYAWQVASNLFVSFKYAWAGIRYGFMTQRNFRIHTLVTFLAISLSCLLKVELLGIAVITLTCALVMVLELLNTALESVVDLTVGKSYHELAKIAKDCAAGAVMLAAMAAVIVAGCIMLPRFLLIFAGG